MAEPGTLHDAFIDELRDTYDAERQLTKALPKMAKAASFPDLDEEKAADQKLSKLAEGGINATAAEQAHGELATTGASDAAKTGRRKTSK